MCAALLNEVDLIKNRFEVTYKGDHTKMFEYWPQAYRCVPHCALSMAGCRRARDTKALRRLDTLRPGCREHSETCAYPSHVCGHATLLQVDVLWHVWC